MINSISHFQEKGVKNLTEIFSSNETNDFALPLCFEGNGTAMHAGIVNINSNIIDNAKFKDTNNENVLGIHMIDEGYYTFTSKLGYTLSTSKYYQISMKVYTEPLIDQNNSKGVSLKLSSFDDTFTNIVSNGKWTTYTFYVNPDKDTTTNLVFSLGDENNLTSGYAFLSDIEIKDDLTKEQYSEIKSSQNVRVLSKVIANENESETETKTSKSKTNWWMIISSMVFPIVIIVAIVVILLRKVKWKKFAKKKTKTDYDRKETVNVQVASRRATMIREENIRKTKAELNELTAEHVKYEEEYKQNLLELRKLKIKRGDALEIKNLEKNCKKIQKTSASLGMNINKLKSKLDYMQTDAYYNNLVKQISSNKFVDENK